MRAPLERWLRVTNPFAVYRSMAEAQRAARLSSIGLLIQGFVSLASTIWFALNPDWMTDQIGRSAAVAGLDPQMVEMQEAMVSALMPASIIIGVVIALAVSGGLAIAQWRMVTSVIPILVLLWTAYATIMSVVRTMVPMLDMTPALPIWLTALSWTGFTICFVLNISGPRGAREYRRLALTE